MRKTKIICTIGPVSQNEETLEQLIRGGMNVARMNFSHGTHDEQGAKIDKLKQLRQKLSVPLAILLDTRGPEVRTGHMQNGAVELQAGQETVLTVESCEGTAQKIPVNYAGLIKDIGDNQTILIDDGSIRLKVLEVEETEIRCRAENGGIVRSRKGVNIPGAHLSLPVLSENDSDDILFGIKKGIDYVAVSFTRSKEDIQAVRSFLDSHGGGKIRIIAKIENSEGVDNMDAILNQADGVMVARGDLAVEVAYQQVPFIQKDIINCSLSLGKPVVVATQMLDSMIENPHPSRAEISDIYNAVNEETSTLMLSGETALGKNPLKCLKVMSDTAEYTESRIDYSSRFFAFREKKIDSATGAVSNAAVNTAYDLNAKALVVLTTSGHTAYSISRLRPSIPLLTFTPDLQVYHQLALNWGVIPFLTEREEDFERLINTVLNQTRQSKYVEAGDTVVIVAGIPAGQTGRTNTIRVEVL